MKIFDANITLRVSDYLHDNLKHIANFEKANEKLHDNFGIKYFFDNDEDLETLKKALSDTDSLMAESDRAEYGDFQTNAELANKVASHLVIKNISPELIIEPTCGKGNFIIASLENFNSVKYIYGIEIYKPYVWETKFSIINFFLDKPNSNKPEILIFHCNIFDFDFKQIASQYSINEVLIIGNPPWVTNSKLGSLNSTNIPKKTNFKNHNGLDAMTGKSNFDIAEFITLKIIEIFQKMNGSVMLLIKNSVIKNIVFDQIKNNYQISSIEKHNIDSKKEFNVSVEASLFYCKLNSSPSLDCIEFNFYDNEISFLKFGWLTGKFVSNVSIYSHTKEVDGECPFVWRQGLKHDCSTVMELERINGHYINGLHEEVYLEDGLVYGILKSSDLKNEVISQTRKFTIVTQKRVGQDTKFIKNEYPKTYQYLTEHEEFFDARKSSIYNNKPKYSIFGIGEYSFKPYKVAISGLYKTFHFTLILPQENKPVMLDDTCYLISFENIEFAAYSLILLNSSLTKQFLQSVTFADAKRTFTKDVLMRINLIELAKSIQPVDRQIELKILNEKYTLNLTMDLWDSFIKEMTPINGGQTTMFS